MARWTMWRETRTHLVGNTECFAGLVIIDARIDPTFEAFWTCPNCQHDMHDIGGTTYDETDLTNDL